MRRVPPLHLITDDRVLAAPDFAETAAEALRRGGPAVALHLRARTTPARALLRLAHDLGALARDRGAWLVVNDRVDVALAAGAHGVQLGGGSPSPRDARRLLGPGPAIGASVHSAVEAAAAERDGADFLVAGTLFATPSHPGRPGTGTGWLRDAARCGIPVIGIGGVAPERVAEVLAAGAAGVAALRGVWDAPRPLDGLEAYLEALDRGRSDA